MAEQNSHPAPSIAVQLKEASKLTRTRWAAWLQLIEGRWKFVLPINLSKGKQAVLLDFIGDADTATWLAGAFTSGRMRSRQTGSYSAALGCQRLFVFPSLQKRSSRAIPGVLLVGADNLEKASENIYRVLALNSPIREEQAARQPEITSPDQPESPEIEPRISAKPTLESQLSESWLSESWLSNSLDVYAGVAANPERVLKNVLELLAGYVACDAAYIAIRSGENFRIEAASGMYEADSLGAAEAGLMHGLSFSTRADQVLADMVVTRQGMLFGEEHLAQEHLTRFLPGVGDRPARSGVTLPIVIGQRVIGLVSFVSLRAGAFSQEDMQRLSRAVSRLAYVVENALMFSETARYLQQLALLNEMALSASLGVDTYQVARRVMERLRRTFRTEWAGVYLLSQDRKTLREYGGAALDDPAVAVGLPEVANRKLEQELPASGTGPHSPELTLVEYVVETGLPYRDGAGSGKRHLPEEPPGQPHLASDSMGSCETRSGVHPVLVVPLKYQGTVIGALALQSLERDAFTQQDEQLLVVIASHMAGLFENMRLNEETRQRAQKLQDTVRQLQTVREIALDIGESAAGSPSGNLDLHGLLQRVARRARQLVDARGAELGLVDTDAAAPADAAAPQEKAGFRVWVSDTPWLPLHPSAPQEISKNAPASSTPITGMLASSGFPLAADLAAYVAASGEPLVVNETKAWKGGLHPERELPFKAIACVPLKYQSSVIGVLIVSDDRPEKNFRPEDIQLLDLLSPLVAVWIRNARLYQELQERIEAQQVAENRLVRSARLAAVGEMAAGVAHELNNPLTTVVGFVELALEDLPKDSPQYPDLELVLREAQRARGVVRRLLDFSRPPENQHVRADLNELVSDVLTLVHHLVRTGGVEMHIELWNDLPWIAVDSGQIKQVLLNLIHNAIQAMPRGGTLTVKTGPIVRSGQDWLAVSIADTGIGIPPENLERIFEPFFTTRRVGRGSEVAPMSSGQKSADFQGSLPTEDTGTGLGLSVSYGIVSEHHGSIEVESQPGQGSCFTIYLPVDSAEDGGAGDKGAADL